jgi:hypothetical protein
MAMPVASNTSVKAVVRKAVGNDNIKRTIPYVYTYIYLYVYIYIHQGDSEKIIPQNHHSTVAWTLLTWKRAHVGGMGI